MIITSLCFNKRKMLSVGFVLIDESVGGLMEGKVNTFLFDTSQLRTHSLWKAVSFCLEKGGLVYYIDLDTAFTVFLEQKVKSSPGLRNLVLFTPALGEVEDVFSQVLSVKAHPPKLIVVDSASAFYRFFEPEVSSGEVNRALGLYLSMLQNFAFKHGTCILVTSLVRAKKLKSSGSWAPFYPGGRVLNEKSGLILMFKSMSGFFQVKVLKHPSKSLVGSVYRISVDDG